MQHSYVVVCSTQYTYGVVYSMQSKHRTRTASSILSRIISSIDLSLIGNVISAYAVTSVILNARQHKQTALTNPSRVDTDGALRFAVPSSSVLESTSMMDRCAAVFSLASSTSTDEITNEPLECDVVYVIVWCSMVQCGAVSVSVV